MMWRGFVAGLMAVTLLRAQTPGPSSRKDSPDNQNQPTFSVSVDLVKVPVSVFDENGVMIRDLRREDFIVHEDGAQQQVRSFGIDRNALSAVLVLDTSATVRDELKKIKEAAGDFTDVLTGGDRVSVITFSDDVALALDWTEDLRLVQKSLRKVEPGLRTALYDAMYAAAAEQLRDVEGRKAIILLTDGLNNQSSVGFREAAQSVVQSQASLYVVSKTVMVREAARSQRRVVMLSGIYRRLFGDDDYIEQFFRKRESEMIELAERTGGRCLFPRDYDQVKGVYQEVARELKSTYYLTYVSNQAKRQNTYHNITVEYLPTHSKLVYRKGYYYQPDPVHKRRVFAR